MHTLTLEDDLDDFSDLYLQVEEQRLDEVIEQYAHHVGDLEGTCGCADVLDARILRVLIRIELQNRESSEDEYRASLGRGWGNFDDRRPGGGAGRKIERPEIGL